MDWKDDQKLALTTEGNLLVSASAGSGKTTVMIEKILRILDEGGDIRRILAVTFSRAGAQDMKEKLVKELYKRIRGGGQNVEKLKKQAEYVPSANISTIDGFCYNLYKRYFVDLNMSPSYGVIDEKSAKSVYADAVTDTVEKYLERVDDGAFFGLAEKFMKNRRLETLNAYVIKISEFMDSLTDENEFVERAVHVLSCKTDDSPVYNWFTGFYRKKARKIQEELEGLVGEKDFVFGNVCTYNVCTYMDIISTLNNYINNIIEKKTYKAFVSEAAKGFVCRNVCTSRKFTEAQAEWVDGLKGLKARVKQLIDEISSFSELKENYDDNTVNEIKTLFKLCLDSKAEYKKLKEQLGGLDFPDLGRLALRLLAIPGKREEIVKQFDYIFVDEYQDTNYLQESIIKGIAGEENLYMVGDPKQSIYSFRFAEPKLFIDRYRKYNDEGGGTKVDLNCNFRSDERILSFVNAVMSQVMTYDFGGVDYRNTAKLVKGRAEYPVVGKLPQVEVAYYTVRRGEKDPPARGIYDVSGESFVEEVRCEDAYIVSKINSIVGKEYIFDTDRGRKRLIKYGDIAVLMRARRGGDSLMTEMSKAGIPYSARDFENDDPYEKGLLLDCLRVIDNFADDIPLANVMQSEIFGFSGVELLKIRKNSPKIPFWEAVNNYQGDQTINNKIELMKKRLDYYRKKASFFTVFDLFREILKDGFQKILLKKGKETAEKVNCFINSVEGAGYASTITEFLSYCKNQDVSQGIPPLSGDAVRFFTIHKSKGLEFPVVFIARADSGFSAVVKRSDIALDGDFGLALLSYDEKTRMKTKSAFSEIFRLKSDYKDKEEMLRLMYVAMTRAKNHLFISGKRTANAASKQPDGIGNIMSWITYAEAKDENTGKYLVDITDFCPETSDKKSKISAERSPVDFTFLSCEYKYKAQTLTPAKYSVTELSKSRGEGETEPVKRPYYEKNLPDIGTLYHRIMQLLDFSKFTPDGIEEQLKGFLTEKIITEGEYSSLDRTVFSRVLKSPIMDEARKNGAFKEKEFMLYLPYCEIDKNVNVADKVLVQGVIDLLILGEAPILVDYKYSNASPETLRERYSGQLDIYALAAEKILCRPVKDKYICQIKQNNWIKI